MNDMLEQEPEVVKGERPAYSFEEEYSEEGAITPKAKRDWGKILRRLILYGFLAVVLAIIGLVLLIPFGC